jgi:DNA-binding NtrC family response regulator
MLMHQPTAVSAEAEAPLRKDLKTLLEDYEKALIKDALQATGGNQRQAAFALGILPTTLHEKLKRLGLMTLRGSDGVGACADSSER